MREMQGASKGRWLAVPASPAEAELREALDQAAAREADEVALRRVWARLAEMPALVPQSHFYDGQDVGRHEAQAQDRDRQIDEARTRRVRWPWIVAASLAGATATLAFMLIETKSEFRSGRREQAQLVQPANGNAPTGIDAGQRSTLVAPATVRTGFGETLHLSLRGGTEVVVTSESTLVLDQNDRPAVSAGEVQFHVPHQAVGQTFSVGAGAYRVVVVGTRFRVRVNQASAAVGVDEGVVEVWTDHRIARLSAGESWVSPSRNRENGDSTTGPLPAQEATVGNGKSALNVNVNVKKASSSTSTARLGRSDSSTASPGTASSSKGGAVRASLALNSPSSASVSSAATSSFGSSSGRGETIPSSSQPNHGSAGQPSVIEPIANVNAPPPAAPPTDFAALALQARAARSSGDARRALGLYRTLAQKGGPTGENAEYEIGRVLRDGLHQPREAVAAWRTYRVQHPRGLLRIEADISLIETLISLGDKAGAVSEASDFVRRYPDSERRAEIARVAGDLYRERGECRDAVRVYDIALGSGHSRREVSDAAAFHRSVCLLQDDRAEGTTALHEYLQSFPTGRFHVEAQHMLSARPSEERSAVNPR